MFSWKDEPEYTNMASPGVTYPQGEFVNEAVPGDLTGTPFERKMQNDKVGFLQRLIFLAGITPSGVAENATYKSSQIVQAQAEIFSPKQVSHRDDLTVPSVVNIYAIQGLGVTAEISAPRDQMVVKFEVPITNTSSCTLNVDQTVANPFVNFDGTAFTGDELIAGSIESAFFNFGLTRWQLIKNIAPLPSGSFKHNQQEQISATATTLTFRPGVFRGQRNIANIVLTADLIKNLVFPWVVGDSNAGAAVALSANKRDFKPFLIVNKDGTVDGGMDDDPDAANLLALAGTDWIDFIRIKRFVLDGVPEIRAFKNVGPKIEFDVPIEDYSDATVPVGQFIQSLESCPVGEKMILGVKVRGISTLTSGTSVRISDPDGPIPSPNVANAQLQSESDSGGVASVRNANFEITSNNAGSVSIGTSGAEVANLNLSVHYFYDFQ